MPKFLARAERPNPGNQTDGRRAQEVGSQRVISMRSRRSRRD